MCDRSPCNSRRFFRDAIGSMFRQSFIAGSVFAGTTRNGVVNCASRLPATAQVRETFQTTHHRRCVAGFRSTSGIIESARVSETFGIQTPFQPPRSSAGFLATELLAAVRACLRSIYRRRTCVRHLYDMYLLGMCLRPAHCQSYVPGFPLTTLFGSCFNQLIIVAVWSASLERSMLCGIFVTRSSVLCGA